MELQRKGTSNFVGALSLCRLHRAVEMAATMVTFVPSNSHPQQGLRKGPPRRAPGAEATIRVSNHTFSYS